MTQFVIHLQILLTVTSLQAQNPTEKACSSSYEIKMLDWVHTSLPTTHLISKLISPSQIGFKLRHLLLRMDGLTGCLSIKPGMKKSLLFREAQCVQNLLCVKAI
jgi:hypothetical protein